MYSGLYKKRFDMKHLIRSIVVSHSLKNDAELSDVLQTAIDVAVDDDAAADHYKSLVTAKEGIVVSPTSLSKYRLILDIAFMKWRQIYEPLQDVHLYLMADSSPQGGRNWFCLEHTAIQRETVPLGDVKACAHGRS